MKVRYWIGLAGVIGVGMFAAKTMLEPEGDRSPRGILHEVERRATLPGFDERAALRDIERSLQLAIAGGKRGIAGELLALHADILRELGSLRLARLDLERILAEFRPGNLEIDRQIGELLWLDGDVPIALEHVTRLQERAPNFGPGWVLLGHLEHATAVAHLVEAKRRASIALPEEDAAAVHDILTLLAALDPRDEARIPETHALRAAFGTAGASQLEPTLNFIQLAADGNSAARTAYARSLKTSPMPEAMAPLLQMMVDAREYELALDLGLAAQNVPAIAVDYKTTQVLVETLSAQGRVQELRALMEAWSWQQFPADAEFYSTCCEALYHGALWSSLGSPVNRMRQTGASREDSIANFYLGMSLFHRKRFDKAETNLLRYFKNNPQEPFPGALAQAWFALADCYRSLGDSLERQTLQNAISLGPNEKPPAWLRLAELQLASPNTGYRIPEEHWTRGMSLLPSRTDEMLERWAEIGMESLKSDGRTLQSVYGRMRGSNQLLPFEAVGPWALFRLGEMHLEYERPHAALAISNELRNEYPGLLPALDLAIRAQLDRGFERQAADLLLERLALAGRDAATVEYLGRLSPGTFSREQVMEAVRIDPMHTGRLVVARHLLEKGEPERAFKALRVNPDDVDPETILTAARASLLLERYNQAIAAVETLPEDSPFSGEARDIEVRARLASDNPQDVQTLVAGLVGAEEPDRDMLMFIGRQLVKGGDFALARQMYTRLDADPATRGGDLLLAMALASGLMRDREAADAALERAEAFDPTGGSEFARMLFALEDRDWLALPGRVSDLRATEFRPSASQEVILSVFEERLEDALALAKEGLAANPTSARWGLILAACQSLAGVPIKLPAYFGNNYANETSAILRGRGDAVRDPREVLSILVALEHKDWVLWAAPRVFGISHEAAGGMWPAFLGALTMLELGDANAAKNFLSPMHTRYRRFGPAWDMALQIEIDAGITAPYAPELVELRTQRARSLGEANSADSHQVLIDRAAKLMLNGTPRPAIALLRDTFEDPNTPIELPGRDLFAQLLVQTGDYANGIQQMARACEALPRASDHTQIAQILEWIETANKLGMRGMNKRLVEPLLKRLSGKFPDDPLIPLVLAEREIGVDERNPALDLGRSFQIIDDFRERTNYIGINDLREGGTELWTRFFLAHDPVRAEEFLINEIQEYPGDTTLWIQLGSALEAQGRTNDAMELYEDLVVISSDPVAHGRLAWMLSRHGGSPIQIERHLKYADRSKRPGEAIRAQYTRLRVQLTLPKAPIDSVIDKLSVMWQRRDEVSGHIDEFELGMAYTTALLKRRLPRDLRRTRELLPTLGQLTYNQYSLDTLRCLDGLITHVPPTTRPKEQAKPEETPGETPGETPLPPKDD
jgi:tetratricopeptide (TPR) repeat protein